MSLNARIRICQDVVLVWKKNQAFPAFGIRTAASKAPKRIKTLGQANFKGSSLHFLLFNLDPESLSVHFFVSRPRFHSHPCTFRYSCLLLYTPWAILAGNLSVSLGACRSSGTSLLAVRLLNCGYQHPIPSSENIQIIGEASNAQFSMIELNWEPLLILALRKVHLINCSGSIQKAQTLRWLVMVRLPSPVMIYPAAVKYRFVSNVTLPKPHLRPRLQNPGSDHKLWIGSQMIKMVQVSTSRASRGITRFE